MPSVFDGEVVGLAPPHPPLESYNGTKDSLDSEASRGQGNGPDDLACPVVFLQRKEARRGQGVH